RVQAVILLASVGPDCLTTMDRLLAAPGIGEISSLLAFRWTPWIARVRLTLLRHRQGRPLYPAESAGWQVWGHPRESGWPLWRTFLTEQRALLRELRELEAAATAIKVPVLLIADPADSVVPVRTSHRLAEMLPDSRLLLVHGAGHHLPRRASRAIADAIAEFLPAANDSQPTTDADGFEITQAG
ncbi:MAG TPA: alpha/beta hydrolase, partial [Trebonia sp.]|nr:alpha/beta hydrolase [Trebonia sp.]